jgi:hypothetical protein
MAQQLIHGLYIPRQTLICRGFFLGKTSSNIAAYAKENTAKDVRKVRQEYSDP